MERQPAQCLSTRSCRLGATLLKTTSLRVFQSFHMVRIRIDLAPLWVSGGALATAVSNQELKSSSRPGMQVVMFSWEQMSNQICCEKDH